MPAPSCSRRLRYRKIERWRAQRKAAIVVDVLKGKISAPEPPRKYGVTFQRRVPDSRFAESLPSLRSINRAVVPD